MADSVTNKEQAAWWEGMDSRQCRLVLNDPQRGYGRLCNEAKGRYKYGPKLTKNALMAQYRSAYPEAKYPEKLGAGTWIKTVRDAGDKETDRWIGVGIWGKVFRAFQLDLRESDIEWKPSNRSLVACFDSLNKEEVTIKGGSAESTVRIVNTYITNWDFLRKCFTQAIARSADIQILLLDYASPQVAYRAHALGMKTGDMKAEIRKNLLTLTDFYRGIERNRSTPPRFEVRLFDAAPVTSLYWFDNVCYMGLHWMGQPSIEAPQFRIEKEKNSVLFASLEKHFDNLWASADGRSVLPEKGVE